MTREIIVALILLVLVGCGSGESEAERKSDPAPADIRSAVPAYQDATDGSSVRLPGQSADGLGWLANFKTGDAPVRVLDFYAEAARRAGFRISERSDRSDGGGFTAVRGDGDRIELSVGSAEGATSVQILTSNGAEPRGPVLIQCPPRSQAGDPSYPKECPR